MEKIDNTITTNNHGLTLTERKNLLVSGVKKIENFDEEEFLMETTMGMLTIKGKNLELIKLDTIQGNVSIKGIVNLLEYSDNQKQKDSSRIFNRLFK